jgi:hypothetical protein
MCLLQKPCPALIWNSYAPHAKHEARLLALENVPGSHLLHMRSDMAVGAMVCHSPAAHPACFVQELLPLLGWNASSSHAVHASVLLELENDPAPHGWQRAGDGSVALAKNVPGKHGSCTAGTSVPTPQYVPTGHLIGSFVPLGQK